ncbi:glycosyltransferase [Arthrobacter bambusae]|uniref:glycosyltransferase n=1 Tax=Arthrobacter bambusae TaxID=1338426 RepID=UPI002783B8EE|nr:glycosyltransferase [Arthrobacter bambusae]MDQ0212050.1 glycosyltransferase involved in cell wall biosynthesis [Arthrobacter bambusae]MDQ0236715.1 glycosyltransferase involved in cell wall biosynthesis [Arthrobacter bambusae]
MSVSIGLPYTDQGEILGYAIRSILAQSFEDWELILYGDSPDNQTRAIAHKFNDPRIRFYENNSRNGLAATLNQITSVARYSLIARMDGDDIMHPDRISIQKRAFDSDPSIDVLGTRAYLIDESSNLIGLFKEPSLPETGEAFLNSNAFSHPTVMATKKWLSENPYDESLLRGEDKELWLRTWKHSKFVKLQDRLMFYRRPRQMSLTRMRKDEAYNRHIMSMYARYENSAFSRARRVAASHSKEKAFAAIGLFGLSSMFFDTKWDALDIQEFSTAYKILERLTEREAFDSVAQTSVTAATVTYGDRWELTKRTVDAALNAGAAGVIIVDNGSARTAQTELDRIASADTRIRLVRLKSNGGSAVGFAQAVRSFIQSDGEYLWLLDDDNECRPDALGELINAARSLESADRAYPVGVCAVRPSNPLHAAIHMGVSVDSAFPPQGSFMYFDLFQRIRRLLEKLKVQTPKTPGEKIIDVPYAPYGGLLVPRESLEVVGYPNIQLGLYEDDTEFTARFRKLGGRLAICLTAIVNDIDPKWTESNGHAGLAGLIHASDSKRTFFAVRNRVAFDAKRSEESRMFLRFALNRLIFSSAVIAFAIKYRKFNQGRQIFAATKAGLKSDFSRIFFGAE